MTDFPHGFNPVERNQALLQPKHVGVAPPIALGDLVSTIPDTPLVRKAVAHLQPLLPLPIWNHSHRAYLHGPQLKSSDAAVAIKTVNFPEWSWNPESFYLTCLFHDLGAAPASIRSTKMSFEFHGAFLAHRFLLPDPDTASQDLTDLADSVAEAICRHTNFIEGKISTHGQMIQLGTLYDNVGANSNWISPTTEAEIVNAYPRLGWTKCFGDAMKDEVANKPWSHTTFYDAEDIWSDVEGNVVAKPFEAAELARQ